MNGGAIDPAEARQGPTPVNLLTGFLGSGKTTLLQRLLTDAAMANAAVLINEFGEVGLDHHLLERIDDNVVLLKSGCVCCTVRGEVADALQSLHAQRARGEIPFFDRVVIESTGLADPYPALSTLRAHPVLKSQFCVGKVITTVDAVNGLSAVARRLEAVRQIAAADIIAVTKTDLCDERTTMAVNIRLGEINPTATIITAADATLLSRLTTRSAQSIDDHQWTAEVPPTRGEAQSSHDASHHGSHHHHHPDEDEAHAVRSFSMVFEDDVDWTGFGIWLTMLLNRHGDRIFRVKGILNVAGEANPVAIHAVQRLVHPPVHMKRWPDERRQSRIVFIAEGIDPQRIRRSFEVFSRLAARVLFDDPVGGADRPLEAETWASA